MGDQVPVVDYLNEMFKDKDVVKIFHYSQNYGMRSITLKLRSKETNTFIRIFPDLEEYKSIMFLPIQKRECESCPCCCSFLACWCGTKLFDEEVEERKKSLFKLESIISLFQYFMRRWDETADKDELEIFKHDFESCPNIKAFKS